MQSRIGLLTYTHIHTYTRTYTPAYAIQHTHIHKACTYTHCGTHAHPLSVGSPSHISSFQASQFDII